MKRISNSPTAGVGGIIWGLAIFVLLAGLSGCSGTRHLKQGETFYKGANVNFELHGKVVTKKLKKRLNEKLEEFFQTTANTRILGSRPGVWVYFTFGNPNKKKGVGNWIKRSFGQAPVLLKDANPASAAKVMKSQLYNMGYFDARVSSKVVTRGKSSTVTYTADLYPPYRLKEINYAALTDTGYAPTFKSLRSKSILKPGQRFNLERLQQEQARIEEVMQNLGFYYFNKRYILFEADSSIGNREVNIKLTFEEKMPPKAIRIYHLNEVKVYPDYVLSDTLLTVRDTTNIDGFEYIDNRHFFRPRIITNTINLTPGSQYTRTNRELTLGHLSTLGTFKFVNIKFSDASKDSASLNTTIFLTPRLKKNIRLEVEGISKSNNFVGPGLTAIFTNRNFLRGAELFQVKVNTGYEVQISRQQANPLNSFEFGVETSLSIPRFLTPMHIEYSSKRYLPQTQFKLGYTLQQRVGYFQLNSFRASYGYTWRESTSKTHTLYPVDINYIEVSNRSDAFNLKLSQNPALNRAFENQFIPGIRYSFTFNTQLSENSLSSFTETKTQRSSFYFNTNVELAGNLLHALQKSVGSRPGEDGSYTLLGSPYSQYVRLDFDFRYYWQISQRHKLATRIITGAGFPYGNSGTLPYIKQFSIGGANSIRAFPARSIGPGAYNVRKDPAFISNTYFIDQRGDLKLEGNVEYRFDILKILKGALFVDAGNIWLLKDDPERPGGKFDSRTFASQLAVGSGFGLRFDLNFFVLRFDLGIPVRKPDEGWVVNKINPISGPWRADNLLLNISIGYPF